MKPKHVTWQVSLRKIATFVSFSIFLLFLMEIHPVKGKPALSDSTSDKKQLEAFFDGILSVQLKSYHIAGAAISVVKDGKLLFAKGYGYSNIDKREKVDPSKTVFRVGSLSSLVTATAVMQLVEEKKIKLGADINDYLPFFKIPNTFNKPITLSDLLTYTSGFENRFNLYTLNPHKLVPFDEFMKNNVPVRIRPAGRVSDFSNYGMALAGYIVEQVSDTSFARYINQRIFSPLGMKNSTFDQPLPQKMLKKMSVGYTYDDGLYVPGSFEYVKLQAAAGMSTTAVDMSKFLITQLQNGRYDSTRILSDSAATNMHRRHYVHDPEISGIAYGFYEMYINNCRIIGHAGNTYFFHSLMALIPKYNLGIFVSYNSKGGKKAYMELLHAFMDQYFPVVTSPKTTPINNYRQRSYRYTGFYWPTKVAYSTIAKLLLLAQTVSIHSTNEGHLLIHGLGNGPSQWIETKPAVFTNISNGNKLVFHLDGSNNVKEALLGNEPYITYYRIPWFMAPVFQVTLVGICILIFISFIITWPFNRYYLNSDNSHVMFGGKEHRIARIIALWISILNLVFLIGMTSFFENPATWMFDIPLSLKMLLVLPILSTLLTIPAIIFLLFSWKDGYWNIPVRIHFSMVVIAAMTFVPILMFWNLLGFHF